MVEKIRLDFLTVLPRYIGRRTKHSVCPKRERAQYICVVPGGFTRQTGTHPLCGLQGHLWSLRGPGVAAAANVAFSGAVPAFVLENKWLGLEEALTVVWFIFFHPRSLTLFWPSADYRQKLNLIFWKNILETCHCCKDSHGCLEISH